MSTTTLSETAAIKAARRAVGSIIRRGQFDYVIYAPYYDADPAGPSTELQANTYPRARQCRTQKVANIALALMGHQRAMVIVGDDGDTVEQLVKAGIEQARKGYPYDFS